MASSSASSPEPAATAVSRRRALGARDDELKLPVFRSSAKAACLDSRGSSFEPAPLRLVLAAVVRGFSDPLQESRYVASRAAQPPESRRLFHILLLSSNLITCASFARRPAIYSLRMAPLISVPIQVAAIVCDNPSWKTVLPVVSWLGIIVSAPAHVWLQLATPSTVHVFMALRPLVESVLLHIPFPLALCLQAALFSAHALHVGNDVGILACFAGVHLCCVFLRASVDFKYRRVFLSETETPQRPLNSVVRTAVVAHPADPADSAPSASTSQTNSESAPGVVQVRTNTTARGDCSTLVSLGCIQMDDPEREPSDSEKPPWFFKCIDDVSDEELAAFCDKVMSERFKGCWFKTTTVFLTIPDADPDDLPPDAERRLVKGFEERHPGLRVVSVSFQRGSLLVDITLLAVAPQASGSEAEAATSVPSWQWLRWLDQPELLTLTLQIGTTSAAFFDSLPVVALLPRRPSEVPSPDLRLDVSRIPANMVLRARFQGKSALLSLAVGKEVAGTSLEVGDKVVALHLDTGEKEEEWDAQHAESILHVDVPMEAAELPGVLFMEGRCPFSKEVLGMAPIMLLPPCHADVAAELSAKEGPCTDIFVRRCSTPTSKELVGCFGWWKCLISSALYKTGDVSERDRLLARLIGSKMFWLLVSQGRVASACMLLHILLSSETFSSLQDLNTGSDHPKMFSIMHMALLSGSKAMVAQVLGWCDSHGLQLNWHAADSGGYTPLHLLAMCDAGKLVPWLLSCKPDALHAWDHATGGVGIPPAKLARNASRYTTPKTDPRADTHSRHPEQQLHAAAPRSAIQSDSSQRGTNSKHSEQAPRAASQDRVDDYTRIGAIPTLFSSPHAGAHLARNTHGTLNTLLTQRTTHNSSDVSPVCPPQPALSRGLHGADHQPAVPRGVVGGPHPAVARGVPGAAQLRQGHFSMTTTSRHGVVELRHKALFRAVVWGFADPIQETRYRVGRAVQHPWTKVMWSIIVALSLLSYIWRACKLHPFPSCLPPTHAMGVLHQLMMLTLLSFNKAAVFGPLAMASWLYPIVGMLLPAWLDYSVDDGKVGLLLRAVRFTIESCLLQEE